MTGEHQAPAVVIGLDSTTGLQTARILAARGIAIIGVAGDPRHACCRTRACREQVVADPMGPGLVDALVRLGRRLPARAVLFPCSDLSVLTLSRRRDEIEPWFHVVLPDAAVIERLVDKGRFARWAEAEGLPIPRTRLLRTAADVAPAAGALRFPCILKPDVRSPDWKARIGEKGFRVELPGDLLPLFDRCAPWAETLLLQEFVEGDDTAHVTCNLYVTKAGEAAVTFTSRKLRQWPIVAGEGSLSEEVRDDRARDLAIRLFRAAGHQGLGYVEFKRDARTGEHVIIEPNVGRPTGRSAQAEAAGVELLYTQYCDAVGLPLPEAREQRYTGVKWIHCRRDLQAAVHHWRRGQLTVGEWLRSLKGPKRTALFSWTDPVPFWADLWTAARNVLPRRAGQAVDPPVEESLPAWVPPT